MFPAVFWEALIILALILANGFFAAAEIAIISARRGRLQQLADDGDAGARIALELADDPDRFLPTVQIGITLVGTFAAAFGGARLVNYLATSLEDFSLSFLEGFERGIALTVVVVAISFASVLLGELVPKRLALRHAGGLARFVAKPMNWLAMAGRPVVWSMGAATNAVLFVLGSRETEEHTISVEDIEHMIKSGTAGGVLDPAEQRLAMEALRLGDQTALDIMRPRVDIDALDADTPDEEIMGAVAMANFSRLPLYEGDLDHIIGFVHVKDVLRRKYLGLPIQPRKIMRPVLFVPSSLAVDRLLLAFQEHGSHLAIVLDEFGGTEGMITLRNLLEELVGEIHDEHNLDEAHQIVQRDDNSWLVDGACPIEELFEALKIEEDEDEDDRNYSTLAGLLLAQIGRIPSVGDTTKWRDYSLEVVDMDGQRIDRVMISRAMPDQEAGKA